MIDHREKHAAKRPNRVEFIEATTLLATPTYTLAAIEFAKDPINRSLRAGVREGGKRLFEMLGSTSQMSNVLERVARRNLLQYGYRASIIDHA